MSGGSWGMFLAGGGSRLSQSLAEGLRLEHLSSDNQALKTPFAGAINQDYQKSSDEEEWDLTAPRSMGNTKLGKCTMK
jgi:hypothetical protein